MAFSLHTLTTGTFAPMLRDLSGVLEKGAAYAADKKLDLVNAKLAPDMFTLAMQVKVACDHANNTTVMLSGGEPPARNQDVDASFEAMQARIAKTIATVEAATPESFAGAEDRSFRVPLINDLALHVTGVELVKDWAFPHFYFHVVTAYDILRNAGVTLSKRDYVGHIGVMIRQGG
ncbi:MAG TPA: DUF1993 domain-containing protein [Rhizomicrobium sp.]|jgi:hypothetical protein